MPTRQEQNKYGGSAIQWCKKMYIFATINSHTGAIVRAIQAHKCRSLQKCVHIFSTEFSIAVDLIIIHINRMWKKLTEQNKTELYEVLNQMLYFIPLVYKALMEWNDDKKELKKRTDQMSKE